MYILAIHSIKYPHLDLLFIKTTKHSDTAILATFKINQENLQKIQRNTSNDRYLYPSSLEHLKVEIHLVNIWMANLSNTDLSGVKSFGLRADDAIAQSRHVGAAIF